MPDLQETLEKAIKETLRDPEGAGSDLSFIKDGPLKDWLYVEGNLDVQHLASHVIETLGIEYEYSVQLTLKGRKMAPQGWSSKEFAEEWLNSGQKSGPGEWGPWSKKIVKRRKAGKVEDV